MTLNVFSQSRKVPFQVFTPDGRPVTNQTVDFPFGIEGNGNVHGLLNLDGRGIGEFSFDGAGLWAVAVGFHGEPVNSEPYYEAEALLPVSSSQVLTEPVRMVGIRREPGSTGGRMFATASPVDFARQQSIVDTKYVGFSSNLSGELDDGPVTVVQADGTTPAFAAQAHLYVPEHARPVRSGVSDATGRVDWHVPWILRQIAADRPSGHVDRPTLVVFLPGRNGAKILPIKLGRPTRVALPAPILAQGIVTLGGRPPGIRDASIRIVASSQGRGVLNAALGLDVTAWADGRFFLPGLTPGHYIVQAARDGIWLSHSVELTVEEGKVPPPLLLDIPEPGEPVALEFVDRAGRPIAGKAITLVTPNGPLSVLWPTTYRADAAGLLMLWGLTAGNHTISIPDTMTRQLFFQVREAATVSTPPSLRRVVCAAPRALSGHSSDVTYLTGPRELPIHCEALSNQIGARLQLSQLRRWAHRSTRCRPTHRDGIVACRMLRRVGQATRRTMGPGLVGVYCRCYAIGIPVRKCRLEQGRGRAPACSHPRP